MSDTDYVIAIAFLVVSVPDAKHPTVGVNVAVPEIWVTSQ
jgi:hypothetical protein